MTAEAGGSRWEGRRQARETALRVLYQSEIGRLALADALRSHAQIGDADAIDLDDEARDYANRLAAGVAQSQAALDGYIGEAALNWRLERLAVIDRIVLRLGIHELLSEPGTPPRVVIDEAIELARLYSGDEAARFVNGVLDAVFKTLKEQGKVIG
jgi:N utilization substance protein B